MLCFKESLERFSGVGSKWLSALWSHEMHKTKVSVSFSSNASLFIERTHLVTCHNIHKSNTKLMFKALCLTDKCKGRVSSEPPPLVLSVNLLLQNAARRQPGWYYSHDWLTFFRLHSHISGELTDGLRPGRRNHAYISCSLLRDER